MQKEVIFKESPEEKEKRIQREREIFLNPDHSKRPDLGRIVYDDSPGEASFRDF